MFEAREVQFCGFKTNFLRGEHPIQQEISRLSSAERAQLIDILWESLDEPRVKEVEAKWASESEERIDAVDRGELETIDGPSALRDLRDSIRK